MKRLVLEAAREAFRRDGYAQTRTVDIAERAGVGERVIFRQFGTKSGLFEAAVVDAFATFLHDHISKWSPHFEEDDAREPIAAYVGGLYDLLAENRGLVRTYLASADTANGRPDLLGQALTPLDDLSMRERLILEWGPIDIVVTIRATFGMLLSLAVYGEFLFPGDKPSRDDIVKECTAIILDGWVHRTD